MIGDDPSVMPLRRRIPNVVWMLRALVAGVLTMTMIGCTSAGPVAFASPTLIAAATTSARPSVATTISVPQATAAVATSAVACGTVSEYVRTAPATDGSFVLSSPGRSPLKITLTVASADPTEGQFAGYVCVALKAGVPHPIFVGLGVPRIDGVIPESYVPEGTYPATRAKPAPDGFVVPQACAYVRPPEVGGDQSNWWVDCGAEANRSARGALGPAFTQQGWTRCGPAVGTELFFKGSMRIVADAGRLPAPQSSGAPRHRVRVIN